MRPFETLDRSTTPDGRELTLHRRDGDFYIFLDGEELMSTRVTGSESALAGLTCHALPNRDNPRVLIGGLGLGYTLRTALEALPRQAQVIVAEIFPAVVRWNRELLGSIHRRALVDSRVQIRTADVRSVLAGDRGYDAVLLDVDNGPAAWCLSTNGRLYTREGLEQIRRALSPKGVLAVWSAHPDAPFSKRLGKCGFAVTTHRVRGHQGKGAHQFVFLARRTRERSSLR